jgi:hypothetical protein
MVNPKKLSVLQTKVLNRYINMSLYDIASRTRSKDSRNDSGKVQAVMVCIYEVLFIEFQN